MNIDRYNGAEVLIPLHSRKNLTFRKIKGKSDLIERQLKKEIKKAFKNKGKRTAFVKYVFDSIDKYSNNTDEALKIENLVEGANAIAKYFDLLPDFSKDLNERIEGNKHISKHKDTEGKSYYIIQDITGRNIRIGDELNVIEDWDETKWIFDFKIQKS